MNISERIEGAKRQAQLQGFSSQTNSASDSEQLILNMEELTILRHYCKLSKDEVAQELSRILNYIDDLTMKKLVEAVYRKLQKMNHKEYVSLDFSAIAFD